MQNVTVVFTNGNVVHFAAEEFDADFVDTLLDPSHVNKFPYKDAEGKDSTVHLKPNEIAGVFVTPGRTYRSGESAISYSVGGRK